ncbi:hypothetical protein [Hydrogenophaga atypica]|uniref:Uncharacterized protein n=1 Tax=Hydrogenophaga atypica TaxID=249409 RepID=A0ABW2QLV8_9BURK
MSTLIRPPITKRYLYDGLPVSVQCEVGHGQDEPDATTLSCPQCGLPFVVAQAVLFMATFNARQLTVDGAALQRVS